MHYSDYELLSGRSESRLADLLSEKVNEYINEQHCALRRLQRDLEEVTAERDDMADELQRLRREVERLTAENTRLTTDPVVYMCDEIRVDRAEFVGAQFGSVYDIHHNKQLTMCS